MDQDREMKILESADKIESLIQAAKSVFTSIDVDNSGMVDWEEFRSNLFDEKLQSYFQELDLDVHNEVVARHLFSQLDFDEGGKIDLDEFIDGLAKLKGQARSVDVARVLHNQRNQAQVLLSIAKDIAYLRTSTLVSNQSR